jgi:hypothetical protein
MNTRKIFFLLSLLALVLTGCASLTKREQPKHKNLTLLEDGDSLGQTFVARYDGLESISLFLEAEPAARGSLRLQLRTNEQETTDLRSATLNLDGISSPDFYSFNFPPLQNTTMKDYYFIVNMEGPGRVKAGIADGDTYLNGALYLDNIPQDAQAAFLLAHDLRLALLGVLKEGLTWLVWLAVGLFLYVVPGWALLNLFWPGWSGLHWAEKLGLGGGVSLAIYPITMLWTNLAGLRLGPLYAWLPPLAGLAVIAWRNRKTFSTLPEKLHKKDILIPSSISAIPWADLALIFTIALILGVRFWAIRSLDAPMWGDSYQHTVIAQLIVDNRGLFDSWQPYAEMTTFTYHFGFHSLVAVFHWITKLPMTQAVLWVGQILNGLAVIFLFPLAVRLNRNPWSGVVAVLIAGLLVPMPMYYLNWGRYTQLAGQTILPAAILISWTVLEIEEVNWRSLVPAWIVLGGLALTHYRVLIFALFFLAAYLILERSAHGLLKRGIKIFWMGIGAAIIFLPWLAHISAGKYLYLFSRQITTPVSQLATYTQESNAIGNLFTYLPPTIWLSLPLAIGWGLWRRNKGVALLSLWWLLLFVSTNPAWLNLPGTGAITNFAVMIAAYIPASILVGAAIMWVVDGLQDQLAAFTLPEHYRTIVLATPSVLVCMLIAGLGLQGAHQRSNDIQIPKYALVTRPDIRAAQWIQKNTSEKACFLVNSFPAYGDSLVAGSDAGWWLPILANRKTVLPPLNYGSEQGPQPDFVPRINALVNEILEKGVTHPDIIEKLSERDCEYVYIGQQQGLVNNPQPFLDPNSILGDQNFELIYRQDRVWVFRIVSDIP